MAWLPNSITTMELGTPSRGQLPAAPQRRPRSQRGFLPFFSAYAPSPGCVEAPLILDGRLLRAPPLPDFLFDWTGHPPPASWPSSSALLASPGRFTARSVGTGATEVAAHGRPRAALWQVSLEPLVMTKKSGFKTAIDFFSYHSQGLGGPSPSTPRARSSPASDPVTARERRRQRGTEGLAGASIGPALFMPAEVAPPSRSVTAQLAETAPTTTK